MPPPVLDELSDAESASTGRSIPYGDKEEVAKDESVDENEEEEGGEDVYVVEKIVKHDFTDTGVLLLFVRWKGYPKLADHTWEPEENLLEGAKDALEEYYKAHGGRPEPPQPKPKPGRKRKSMGEKTAPVKKEEPQEQKKRRRSRAATENTDDMKTDTPDDNETEVGDWTPKHDEWEREVSKIDTIVREPDTRSLYAYLYFKNGKKSKVSIDLCYKNCPQAMLKFYESHLVFKDA